MYIGKHYFHLKEYSILQLLYAGTSPAAADPAASGGGVQGAFRAERVKKIGGHFLNLGHFGTYLAKFTPVTGP